MAFKPSALIVAAALAGMALPLAAAAADSAAPMVSVVVAAPRDLVETAAITGTLMPRDEVLIAPEIDGFRIVDLLAEEGDQVVKGQVLVRLSRDLLDAQVAQNVASTARAQAAVEQGRSQIDQAEAAAEEARQSLDRARLLQRSGNTTEAVMEQRISAARSATGRLTAARNGLTIAEADLALARAQRSELDLKLQRTEVRAPVDGIINRRSARLGATASIAAEPLFRMIARGEIELEGDVTGGGFSRMKVGAPADIDLGGPSQVKGRVRVVYPEVDRLTRLGKVRVALDPDPAAHIGAFARGTLEVARRRGLALPLSALLYGDDGQASVMIVADGRVAERKVRTGLTTGAFVEIVDGLAEGDVVVARAGSFLRPGDAVRTQVAAAAGL